MNKTYIYRLFIILTFSVSVTGCSVSNLNPFSDDSDKITRSYKKSNVRCYAYGTDGKCVIW